MFRNNALLYILLGVILLGVLWQVFRIYEIRLENGNLYPPASTYRTDPMGCRVLYEAFARLPQKRIERYTSPILELPEEGKNNTLFFLGVEDTNDAVSVLEKIETFVNTGGRLVITYAGSLSEPVEEDDKISPQKEGEQEKDTSESDSKEEKKWFENIRDRWGFKLEHVEINRSDTLIDGTLFVKPDREDVPLPPSLNWHSSMVFSELHEDWHVLYRRNEHPVLIERIMGKGSMVIATDTYMLSNEAMRTHRQAGLYTWLAGDATHLFFDETHHGIQHRLGVASLIRRYRLEYVLLSFVMLGLLFIWKNATSLLPHQSTRREIEKADAIIESESNLALNNLMHRSIPPKKLLATCLMLWQKDCAQDTTFAKEVEKHTQQAANTNAKEILQNYQQLCTKINQRSNVQRQ